jgi:hypothetical protein
MQDYAKKIFVSIPSYRDPELIPTLLNMIASASVPERLHISVCWQDDENFEIFNAIGLSLMHTDSVMSFPVWQGILNEARVEIICVNYIHSKGACWARYLSESRYAREAYFLQLDAHARFAERWDTDLIEMLEGLRVTSLRPVLSAYVASYQSGPPEILDPTAYRLVFDKFTPDGIPLFLAHAFSAEHPMRGCFISGHFIFADGSFVRDVPNDPRIYFTGEEITMSVKAFMQGYDVYAPHRTIIWHQYGRDGRGLHWEDHVDSVISEPWWLIDLRSRAYVASFLVPDKQVARHPKASGLRTLSEFEFACGLNFLTREIHPRVKAPERCGFFSS